MKKQFESKNEISSSDNNIKKLSFEELREVLIKRGVVDPSGCLNKRSLNGKTIRVELLDIETSNHINERVCNSTKRKIKNII